MLRAIILDFDGVIADTEPLHYLAFAEATVREGIEIREREYFSPHLLGLSDAALLRAILEHHRLSIDESRCAEILRAKDARYAAMIRNGLALLPGVREFIDRFAHRVPLAICSGAHRGEIEQILSHGGLLERFETIVSADDVGTSKPDAAGYLEAVRRLGMKTPALRPADCIAAEDSLHGVRAAHAAGIRVVAIAADANSPAASEADDHVASLAELDDERMNRIVRARSAV